MKCLKKYVLGLVLSMGILIGSKTKVLAQEQKSANEKHAVMRNYYRKTLGLDSLKAKAVEQAQFDYKSALRKIDADTSLNDVARRAKIRVLMDEKNRKLRKLLNPAQQRKVIPTTEG